MNELVNECLKICVTHETHESLSDFLTDLNGTVDRCSVVGGRLK